jgi:radical SAM superfamily enzyme YgiQ (UPF0313 family)
MAKIVLIDPRGWQGAVNNNLPFANVGIAFLIPHLLKNGHEVSVIDLNNELMTDGEVLSLIKKIKPDIISFSVKTATIRDARELANQIKALFPQMPIILGGPHTTLCWQDLIKEPPFDIIFVGEGEQILPIICESIDAKRSVDIVPGVVTKANYKESFNVIQFLNPDLDSLLYPCYDFFPENVKNALKTHYPLLTTRGCIYKCTYCSVSEISGNKLRKRSPENIIEELKYAKKKYGIKSFEIIDDLFNLDIERCKKICRAILNEHLELSWACPNGLRADRVDKELADLMVNSGCTSVMVGIESADPVVLNTIRKGETIEDIERGIRIFQNAGLNVGGYFIIGLPGDSIKSQKLSVNFVKKLGINAHFNMLVPYPGTKLWDWAQKNAHFLHKIEEGLHFADTSKMVDPIFETDDFSASERKYSYEMVHTQIGNYNLLIPFNISFWESYCIILRLLWKYDRWNLPKYIYPLTHFNQFHRKVIQ